MGGKGKKKTGGLVELIEEVEESDKIISEKTQKLQDAQVRIDLNENFIKTLKNSRKILDD